MKNRLKYLLLIVCLVLIPNTYAWTDGTENSSVDVKNIEVKEETKEEVKNYNYNLSRSDMPDYGVHKKWKITTMNLPNVLSTKYVDPSLKIYDYADILTPAQEAELLQKIKAFIELTGMDMVILTDSFEYTSDSENETYAVDFYDYNDFGINDPDYSGVILFRNNNPSDRYYNVYTFGQAQLYFHYDRCEDMLDNIYTYMVEGDYTSAFNRFIEDFTNYYERGKALPDYYYLDDMGYIHKKYNLKSNIPMAVVCGIIATAITLSIMVKKNKMVKKATEAGDYLDKSSIVYNVKEDILTGSITTHHRISSDSGGSGGGGGYHSSGGSSGGGHGGGGGRHG